MRPLRVRPFFQIIAKEAREGGLSWLFWGVEHFGVPNPWKKGRKDPANKQTNKQRGFLFGFITPNKQINKNSYVEIQGFVYVTGTQVCLYGGGSFGFQIKQIVNNNM